MPVLYGVFLYMGVASLSGIQVYYKKIHIYIFFSIFFFMETIIYMPIYIKRKWCIDEKSDTSRKQE